MFFCVSLPVQDEIPKAFWDPLCTGDVVPVPVVVPVVVVVVCECGG